MVLGVIFSRVFDKGKETSRKCQNWEIEAQK